MNPAHLYSLLTDSSLLIRMLVAVAGARGADVSRLLALAGLAPEKLADPEARLPSTLQEPVMEAAVGLLSDDAFGLHVGEVARGDPSHLVTYVFLSAPDLRAGIERSTRYHRLMTDLGYAKLIDEGELARLRLVTRDLRPVWPRQLAEWALSAFWSQVRRYLGDAARLHAVHFQHPAPRARDEHRRIFGCQPHFGEAHNELVFVAELLERPCAAGEGDPDTHALLATEAERRMSALLPVDDLPGSVRIGISNCLDDGDLSLARVARGLGLSARSLQRRLKANGWTFHRLLDDTRRRLAERFLLDTELTADDVAYLLGFSERAVLHRAARKWFGVTPMEYRHAQRARRRVPSDGG